MKTGITIGKGSIHNQSRTSSIDKKNTLIRLKPYHTSILEEPSADARSKSKPSISRTRKSGSMRRMSNTGYVDPVLLNLHS